MLEQVSPSQLSDWVAHQSHRGPVVVLDVRELWELEKASIGVNGFTFVHIPMGQLASRISELNPDQPVACLCHHGGRSMQVANFLVHHGFAHVANVSGGIDAWSLQLDPSVPRY